MHNILRKCIRRVDKLCAYLIFIPSCSVKQPTACFAMQAPVNDDVSCYRCKCELVSWMLKSFNIVLCNKKHISNKICHYYIKFKYLFHFHYLTDICLTWQNFAIFRFLLSYIFRAFNIHILPRRALQADWIVSGCLVLSHTHCGSWIILKIVPSKTH